MAIAVVRRLSRGFGYSFDALPWATASPKESRILKRKIYNTRNLTEEYIMG